MEDPAIGEQRGKVLFDEIFQMSFQMPASGYDARKYTADKLEHMNIGTDEEEAERFRAFAQVFCDIMDMDDSGNISDPECSMFVRMLEFSSITSK